VRFSIVGAVLATSSLAAAQPTGFATLDPLDGDSRAGLLVEYLEPNAAEGEFQTGPCEGCILRVVASARYIHPCTGLGGYVQVPFAYADDAASITAFGDLEAGAIYVPPVAGNLILHAGVALPTGEGGYAENRVAVGEATPMLRDYSDAIPSATTVRAGISSVWRHGAIFARVDLGIDWNIDSNVGTDYGPAFHYNLGVGVGDATSALTLESANLSLDDALVEGSILRSATTFNTLALAARADWRTLGPYVAIVVPLEDDTSRTFRLAVIGGLDVRLP
jgi:hypothetical protein